MSLKTELVLALPRPLVNDYFLREAALVGQGDSAYYATLIKPFIRALSRYIVIAPRHLFERGGNLAEGFVHFASYVTIVSPKVTDNNGGVVLTHHQYARAPSGGEQGLHGALSIGFGGHVNPAAMMAMDSEKKLAAWVAYSLINGATNELSEEILGEDWDGEISLETVVFAPNDPVGRYHLAAMGVYVDPDFETRSQRESDVAMLVPTTLVYDVLSPMPVLDDRYELWSRIMASLILNGGLTVFEEAEADD